MVEPVCLLWVARAGLLDLLLRAAGVLRDELATLFSLGWTFGLNNQRERGLEVLQECLSMTKQLGDMYWRSWALWAVAHSEVDHAVSARNNNVCGARGVPQ
ncbi:hypothetical protein [Saccharopolyspora spinosa]|uniref:hypothetical protein n=1 Tax=Saccharopolyspora spinosa TaxID=60894 RepID=UPI000306819A|nr:hypothetical protein [Saccharopolyspora spinosa]